MAKRSKVKDNARKSRPTTKGEHRAFTDEQIRLRAYEIYVARAETPGDELGDWLQAEQELCSEGNRR